MSKDAAKSERRTARRTGRELASETRRVFSSTVQGFLAAIRATWPEDPLLSVAADEWEASITRAPLAKLRDTRIDVVMELLGERATDPMLALVAARDYRFFDELDQGVEQETSTGSSVARFAAALAGGRTNLLSSLMIGQRMRDDGLGADSIEAIWLWIDRLLNCVVMSRINGALKPSVLGVVSRVQEALKAHDGAASSVDVLGTVAEHVRGIPPEDLTALIVAVTIALEAIGPAALAIVCALLACSSPALAGLGLAELEYSRAPAQPFK